MGVSKWQSGHGSWALGRHATAGIEHVVGAQLKARTIESSGFACCECIALSPDYTEDTADKLYEQAKAMRALHTALQIIQIRMLQANSMNKSEGHVCAAHCLSADYTGNAADRPDS
eukprot:148124-Pelagomonas_calceolata.AAC.11